MHIIHLHEHVLCTVLHANQNRQKQVNVSQMSSQDEQIVVKISQVTKLPQCRAVWCSTVSERVCKCEK